MALNAGQKTAVETFDRNVLLLAPAGTGKTFTLAHKVARALQKGIKPEEILLISFTVKARDEIISDVISYAGETAVNAYTVHGFCFEIIKEYSYRSGAASAVSVVDDSDSAELLKRIADGMIAERTDDKEKLTTLPEKQFSRILSAIKKKKDELGFPYSSAEGYAVAVNELLRSNEFCDAFSYRKYGAQVTDYNFYNLLKTRGKEYCLRYADTLSSSSLVDFDDLLYYAKEIISSGGAETDKYKLVVLDEAQDVDFTEYSIIKNFFSSARVMLCGDENQTIYGWRGSDPKRIFDDYKKNFSPVEIRLTENRRSTKLLRRAAEGYIENAFGRKSACKTETFPDAEKIEVYGLDSADEEAKKIFSLIENFDGKRGDVCVMTRSNRYAAALYKRLNRINLSLEKGRRIPFFTADADNSFYKRPIIKDFTAFLRLIVNPSDVTALDRVCKRFVKSVKTDLVSAINAYGAAGVSLGDFFREDAYVYGDGFHSLTAAYEKGTLVVYDLETTGANPAEDEPVQIAAVRIGKDGEREEFNEFVIPEREISKEAYLTHGYDLEYVKSHGGVPVNTAIRRFNDFIRGCVLVGHNSAAFDDAVLKRIAKREKVALGAAGFYDTLVIAKTFFKNEKNYKLATLCEKFGVVNERAHDAFADVVATERCLTAMLDGYVIPTESVRKTVMRSNLSAFKGCYENMKRFYCEAESGDIFSLVRDMAFTYSLVGENSSAEDRESANDLYLALKDAGNADNPIAAISSFLSDAALSGSKLDSVIKKLDKTPIITVHQSKGCEFSAVILAGAGEDEMPSFPSRMSGDDSEERRVFYVALTRAKKKLYITYAAKKSFGANEYASAPSPYIAYIPKECVLTE